MANPLKPENSIVTTCAYCGVGCSFKAETHKGRVVRMIPWKSGKANHGHSCVKGRFAFDYYNHPDRVRTPMIRRSIDDPWQEVSWETAIQYAASEFRRIQSQHGQRSIGAISSSRCTNEEIFLVQKLARAVMGNNNIDNCARICHSPTQFGMSATVGWGAASQHFDSILKADVILVVGVNLTEGHPVFGSLMKRRIREGAKLIVIDPRRTEMVTSPHCQATIHLALRPGTNVAVLDSIAHVVVREKLYNEAFVRGRCEWPEFEHWAALVADDRYSPEVIGPLAGLNPEDIRRVARLYAGGPNSAIYYGLGVTEHSQGSTGVMCLGNLALACGMLGREGVGVNPMRGQGNVQGGSCLGSWPHVFSGYRFVTDPEVRGSFERDWGVPLDDEPGLRLPNMFDAALTGHFRGMYIMGEDPVQSDPNQTHVIAAMRNMECVVLQDLFLNETSKYAHVFLPGSSSLEKEGTFTNAERRVNRVRKVVEPLAGYQDWEVVVMLMNAMGYPAKYAHAGEILDEVARLSPAYQGMSFPLLERIGSAQWPCDENAPEGTEVLHTVKFPRANGLGTFMLTEYVPTTERTNDQFPLLLTTGRILSQYNVGTQTRRTANSLWHPEDVLEINAEDAAVRGIHNDDWVSITSRFGTIRLRARLSARVNPGIVYTTFHHAKSKANIVTSDQSDWATNCPEYKVTAVEVLRIQPVLENVSANTEHLTEEVIA
ncbi:MAG: formate dehydrogenase subunit alpha [Methylomonas sp.]|nr:MAG: formate dehydrogenase subunit alpha [Methylomonas sp.]PPD26760.1 MAG: formate dehydrogenase subunit alpha [Methylomonas sp.]PPD38595.1 MAG: formate dehydrogenase subunit alpha [Methylomonas sp.]PPD42786.1 MAG: formate dehydrogenase subunit alpha [Methylomonas sp.]PPD55961.1 MAG: formate dehydrogenase subunit alpha [Methylomonas sp.]